MSLDNKAYGPSTSTSFRLPSRQSSEKFSANLPKSLELIMVLRYTKDTERRIEVF